jgi:hypothetical protein
MKNLLDETGRAIVAKLYEAVRTLATIPPCPVLGDTLDDADVLEGLSAGTMSEPFAPDRSVC